MAKEAAGKSTPKINSKKKGNKGELEVVHLFEDFGFSAERTQQFCGNSGEAADIKVKELPGFHIESKRVEKFNLYAAYDQVKRDRGPDKDYGVIFHRRNRKPMVAIMDAEEFLELLTIVRGVVLSSDQST